MPRDPPRQEVKAKNNPSKSPTGYFLETKHGIVGVDFRNPERVGNQPILLVNQKCQFRNRYGGIFFHAPYIHRSWISGPLIYLVSFQKISQKSVGNLDLKHLPTRCFLGSFAKLTPGNLRNKPHSYCVKPRQMYNDRCWREVDCVPWMGQKPGGFFSWTSWMIFFF